MEELFIFQIKMHSLEQTIQLTSTTPPYSTEAYFIILTVNNSICMIQTSFKILQQKVQLSTAIIKFHLTMEIDMKYTKSKLIAITKTLQI